MSCWEVVATFLILSVLESNIQILAIWNPGKFHQPDLICQKWEKISKWLDWGGGGVGIDHGEGLLRSIMQLVEVAGHLV